MPLKKIKLGELIQLVEETNEDLKCSLADVRGISTQKKFIETKANMDGVPLSKYKIVPPQCFAYVPDTSRRGDKISLSYNDTNKTFIVSSISIVFKVKSHELMPDYLFIYFNRPEFDRYSRFNSWGSAREPFSWEDMCDIDFELPPVPLQEKYVKTYLSLIKNQTSFDKGLGDLKLLCDAYIENLKKNIKREPIGQYIELKRDKNSDGKIKSVYGVSNTLKFITASSSVDKENLTNYKIVNYEDIAYVPTTHLKIWAIAISDKHEPFVVSPIYEVFSVKDKEKLCPEYLFLWLCRKETIRYAFFNSWGSARENFVYDDMCNVEMPIPDITVQKAIVGIYNAYCMRSKINDKMKEQIKNICPILIKGCLQEAKDS